MSNDTLPIMADQSSAILRLLDDDDDITVSLVQRKLAETGSLAWLRELRRGAAGRAAVHLDEVIREIGQEAADAAFTELCKHFGEHGDMENASWLLASTFDPEGDFTRHRALLDSWGREVSGRCSNAMTKSERIQVLSEFLGREMRLRGNDDDYYAIDNSLLPRVLDTKLGIPISLALVYMLVGRRAGLQVDGVGLPGHFLARHEDIFFDPFHGGSRIGLEECSALMEQQNLSLTPQHLAPTTPRQMLIRMLTNIYYIAEQSDPPVASKVEMWIEALRQS